MSTPADATSLKINRRVQPRPPRHRASARHPPSAPVDLGQFAQECFEVTIETLRELGFSRTRSREAMMRALHSRKRKRPSSDFLARYVQVGLIINTWRRDKRFLNSDGSPKVIPIYGRGASFETLARKHAPAVPIKTLVAYLCHHADATRSSKNTLALTGSNVLIYAKTPQMVIAALADNWQLLSSTLLHNLRIPVGTKNSGNFQRVVKGFLTTRDFRKFAIDIRPQLQDVCNVVEGHVDDGQGPKGNRKRCGMSIYLFQDSE